MATMSAYDCLVIPNAVTELGAPAHAVCLADGSHFYSIERLRLKFRTGPLQTILSIVLMLYGIYFLLK